VIEADDLSLPQGQQISKPKPRTQKMHFHFDLRVFQ
jgi:hypothetical protein